MKTAVAVLSKKGENAVPNVLEALDAKGGKEAACVGVATPNEFLTAETFRELQAKKLDSPVALGYAASVALPRDEPQMMKFENSAVLFDGIIYSAKEKSALEFVAAKLGRDRCKGAASFVLDVEADYFALIVAEPERLVAARDPVGVQPLYFGENETLAAFATNRKTLWNLGIAEPKSFPPGHIATATQAGFKFEPAKTLTFVEPKPISLDEAAKCLQVLLENSVQKRVSGLGKVTVAFSGGLDSSVVAFLAKKCGVEVQLIHVSLENQPETQEAFDAAEELQLPLQVHLFKESDVEKTIPQVVGLIEEGDPVKASIGLPFFWAAQKTAEGGFKALLAGQGADELFGGYQRYVKEYLADGDVKVRRTMFEDVVNVYESNLERDEKLCGFHDVELRLPFAAFGVVEFAMGLPTELKFEGKADSLRKLVLRKVALNMGLSPRVAAKPKKAVQYSTGINNALKRIAKKKGLTLAEYVAKLFSEGAS